MSVGGGEDMCVLSAYYSTNIPTLTSTAGIVPKHTHTLTRTAHTIFWFVLWVKIVASLCFWSFGEMVLIIIMSLSTWLILFLLVSYLLPFRHYGQNNYKLTNCERKYSIIGPHLNMTVEYLNHFVPKWESCIWKVKKCVAHWKKNISY